MVIADRAADFTLATVLAVTDPDLAKIVTHPRARAVASPPGTIDTTPLFDDAQVTKPVISCVLPSENVPLAVNCWSVPRDKTAFWGAIAIETNVGRVAETVRVAVEVICPDLADTVDTPGDTPFARPGTPPALMVAIAGLLEIHVTEEVTFCRVPSL
jgi:hypothetical protein